VTFTAGDQFGARAMADGTVRVYRNGTLLGSASVAAWPFSALGGRIGVSVYNSSASRFDDFGGGSLPSSLAVSSPLQGLALSDAFPNPTTGRVALSLTLQREDGVGMSVVDVQGREVWSAPARRYGAGRWALGWDGRTRGGSASDGIYFVRVRVGEQQFQRRIAIVR